MFHQVSFATNWCFKTVVYATKLPRSVPWFGVLAPISKVEGHLIRFSLSSNYFLGHCVQEVPLVQGSELRCRGVRVQVLAVQRPLFTTSRWIYQKSVVVDSLMHMLLAIAVPSGMPWHSFMWCTCVALYSYSRARVNAFRRGSWSSWEGMCMQCTHGALLHENTYFL